MFQNIDLAAGIMPDRRPGGYGATQVWGGGWPWRPYCGGNSHCLGHSAPCNHTGPVLEACFQTQGGMVMGMPPGGSPYGGPQPGPMPMPPGFAQAFIPPYCESPTNFCGVSPHIPCLWSQRFEADAATADPAAQLAALKRQLLAQIDAVERQQRAVEAGMKPTTAEETDRQIERLETAIRELREHRAQLERRPAHRGR